MWNVDIEGMLHDNLILSSFLSASLQAVQFLQGLVQDLMHAQVLFFGMW